ncbi:hypothetical protein [Frankia tisae]|uniref:hypothetical protein n=1 Tax=Frankia tisae TaxID=2950104 RepID=UPI0021C11C98|nr:hypothetical protein [Frankia tisae]
MNRVDVAIPVYSEEAALERSVRRLRTCLTDLYPYGWRITIVDKASMYRTLVVADRMAAELSRAQVRQLDVKGRDLPSEIAIGSRLRRGARFSAARGGKSSSAASSGAPGVASRRCGRTWRGSYCLPVDRVD